MKSPCRARVGRPRRDDPVGDVFDLLRAQVAPVLDHDLEAAGGPQAVDRRRLEDVDQPVPDLVLERRLNLGRDHRAGQPLVGPMMKVVEHHVHRAEVGGVGVHQDRLAGDGHGVRHARQLARQLLDALHHRAGSAPATTSRASCTLTSR